MIIQKTLYPKTTRVGDKLPKTITEKLDGYNLGIGVLNGELIIATRNNIFTMEDLYNLTIYKDLDIFLLEHKEDLINTIYEGSIVFGEWLSGGNIHYKFKNKFNIFAKARFNFKIEGDFDTLFVDNMVYDYTLLDFVFKDSSIPDYISKVPLVIFTNDTSLSELDILYDSYISAVGRKVEGFVILDNETNTIRKYVRCKRGKLTKHKIK